MFNFIKKLFKRKKVIKEDLYDVIYKSGDNLNTIEIIEYLVFHNNYFRVDPHDVEMFKHFLERKRPINLLILKRFYSKYINKKENVYFDKDKKRPKDFTTVDENSIIIFNISEKDIENFFVR